jgi:hypothetical protein
VSADKVRGVAIDPRRAQVAFKAYADKWISERADLAERTAEPYRHLLKRHIEPTFGTKTMGELSPSAVRAWNAEDRP